MEPSQQNQNASSQGNKSLEKSNPILSSGGASSSGQPQDELTFKDLVEMLHQGLVIIRSKWYWGLAASLIVLLGLGFVVLRKPIPSKVQTVMLAQGALDKILGLTQQGPVNEQVRENDLRNHLSVMSSRKFRSRLIAAFSPQELEAITTPYKKANTVVDADWLDGLFDSLISVERERGREVYTIEVAHLNPDTALLIANRFTSEYLALVQIEFKASSRTGYELLEKQAKMLSEEIANIEERKLEYRRQNKIISQSDNQGILTERLKRIDASLTETRVKRLQLETQYAQAKQDKAASEYPWDNSYLATFANNALLRQELDRSMAARAALAAKYGPNHPKMRDTDASINGVRLNILRNFEIAVNDLLSQLSNIRETEAQLQHEFDTAFDSSVQIEKLASRLEVMDSEADGKRQTLIQIQKRIGEAALSSELPADFMQVVDPGFLVKPKIPKRLLYIAALLALAGAAFVVTPLAVDLFDERIKGTADLEHLLGLHLLGAIPKLKGRPDERAHIVRNQIDLVTTEAFVGISGGLDIACGGADKRVILLTSTLPEEGKSLIVSNLASAYRQLKKTVVVVDLDLRRPSQHNLHSIKNSQGFLTWMDKGGAVHVEELPDGVGLVPAGGHDAQPSHFFVSPKMTQFLDTLRERFDIVMVDTPPAGVFQDSVVLARYAAERILVVRDERAPVVQVKKVIEDFARAKAPFTGMVLNCFNPQAANKKLAYNYKASTEGYSYKTKS